MLILRVSKNLEHESVTGLAEKRYNYWLRDTCKIFLERS